MAKAYKTYVEFIRRSKTIPAGEATVMPVEDRDIQKLKIPKKAHTFYFYDCPADITDLHETQNYQHNPSRFYIVATKILTAKEADAYRDKKMREEPEYTSDGRLTAIRLVGYKHYALARDGSLIPLSGRNDIVINEKKEILPRPASAKKAAQKAFSPALPHDILAPQPLNFKKPAPPRI